MHKKTKIWLITAIALVAAGLIICTTVLAVYRWDFAKLSTVKYEIKGYEVAGNIESISIATDSADILFVASDEDKCKVVCREPENLGSLVEMKEGILTIGQKDERRWYDYIEIFTGTPEITVYMPAGEYAGLFVREFTGDVEIPADFAFETIDILASTGDVKNYASALGSISIKTSTGDIYVEGVSGAALKLAASTGTINVSDVACSGDLEINVNTGDVRTNDAVCKNLVSTGSTGDLLLENVIAGEKITVERSTGDVKFEGCDGGEIFVDTDTGDVSGTFLFEKIFIVETDGGNIKVPQSTTGGRCEITTDTGDVKLDIQ